MVHLESALVNIEDEFVVINKYLCGHNFCLAGNWDYHHGYLDKPLDQERMVWLRIPFHVTEGALDGECLGCEAMIKLGNPFVFKHLYNTGLDKHAKPNLLGALFNQFQAPIDNDASLEPEWVHEARETLKRVEQGWGH